MQARAGYNRWSAYANTKLANLLFTYELDRRLRAAGAGTVAVAAHPGWARSGLAANGPATGGSAGCGAGRPAWPAASASRRPSGALPTLYAATAPAVGGGHYFGPGGPAELFGPPVQVGSSRRSRRPDDAARLWAASEDATGVHYDLARRRAARAQPSEPGARH